MDEILLNIDHQINQLKDASVINNTFVYGTWGVMKHEQIQQAIDYLISQREGRLNYLKIKSLNGFKYLKQ